MRFTKMQGIGNDYVYVDCSKEKVDNPERLSILVSDRHFGIGSDGLILIKPSDKADFRMEIYNADGSQAKMCGNGIRCVGKYVFDNGLTDKTKVTIDTLSGLKYLTLNVVDGKVKTVRVDMGAPVIIPADIPVKFAGESVVNKPLNVNGTTYMVTCVSMGNPHCITYVDDVDTLNLEKLGPFFENHELFPDRINTEFVKVIDRDTLQMRVWERGSGETLACGTGACATAVATILNGLCNDTVRIILRGGELKITWDKTLNKIFMEGPAEISFTGEWDRQNV